jgi:hypothetical protein
VSSFIDPPANILVLWGRVIALRPNIRNECEEGHISSLRPLVGGHFAREAK